MRKSRTSGWPPWRRIQCAEVLVVDGPEAARIGDQIVGEDAADRTAVMSEISSQRPPMVGAVFVVERCRGRHRARRSSNRCTGWTPRTCGSASASSARHDAALHGVDRSAPTTAGGGSARSSSMQARPALRRAGVGEVEDQLQGALDETRRPSSRGRCRRDRRAAVVTGEGAKPRQPVAAPLVGQPEIVGGDHGLGPRFGSAPRDRLWPCRVRRNTRAAARRRSRRSRARCAARAPRSVRSRPRLDAPLPPSRQPRW